MVRRWAIGRLVAGGWLVEGGAPSARLAEYEMAGAALPAWPWLLLGFVRGWTVH